MAKQFYRQGEKIFEAGSDRYIDMPEWQSDWSGQSSEVSAPSASSIEKKVADTGSSVFANTSSDSNQFNTAMGGLLKSFQGVGTADLLKRKNAILKAKYGRAAEITPEELRTLSPAQQAQVRGGKTEALDPELSSVKGQILDREQGISNFKDIFNMARGLSNDMATRERQIKADAQNTLTGMMELGSGAFDQFSDDDLNQMGSAAGYPAGFLKTAVNNLKKAGAQPDKIVSGPGSSTYAIYFDKDGKIRTETIIAPQYAPKSRDTDTEGTEGSNIFKAQADKNRLLSVGFTIDEIDAMGEVIATDGIDAVIEMLKPQISDSGSGNFEPGSVSSIPNYNKKIKALKSVISGQTSTQEGKVKGEFITVDYLSNILDTDNEAYYPNPEATMREVERMRSQNYTDEEILDLL